MQSRQLSDSEENGYTHPAAPILFGKFNTAEYQMLFDEVRYSEGILDSSLFLRAATWAPEPFEITTFNFNQEENLFTLEGGLNLEFSTQLIVGMTSLMNGESLKMHSFQMTPP